MESHYVKVHTGNLLIVQMIKSNLEDIGIVPILKNDMQTGFTAVLATDYEGLVEVYVHEDEIDKAIPIVQRTLAKLEV
jgi:histidinol phosphatase-like enzyme